MAMGSHCSPSAVDMICSYGQRPGDAGLCRTTCWRRRQVLYIMERDSGYVEFMVNSPEIRYSQLDRCSLSALRFASRRCGPPCHTWRSDKVSKCIESSRMSFWEVQKPIRGMIASM
jgi:hypothetical protein